MNGVTLRPAMRKAYTALVRPGRLYVMRASAKELKKVMVSSMIRETTHTMNVLRYSLG